MKILGLHMPTEVVGPAEAQRPFVNLEVTRAAFGGTHLGDVNDVDDVLARALLDRQRGRRDQLSRLELRIVPHASRVADVELTRVVAVPELLQEVWQAKVEAGGDRWR